MVKEIFGFLDVIYEMFRKVKINHVMQELEQTNVNVSDIS